MNIKKLIAYLHFHIALIQLRKLNDFKTEIVHGDTIEDVLSNLGIDVPITEYDRTYKITAWVNWEEIITNDFVKTLTYLKEFLDCDDFAFAFKVLCVLIHGVSAFPAYGVINDVRHYFNVIIARDGGDLKAYAYEPILGRYNKIRKDKPITIGINNYKIYKIHLF